MYKPRFMMTPRQREQLDAQYAELLEFRRELAAMNPTQKLALASDLVGGLAYMRRSFLLDGAGMLVMLLCGAVSFYVAVTMHLVLFMLIPCLLPLPAMRLLNVYALSRDTYYGMLRQIRELDAPAPASRFDD